MDLSEIRGRMFRYLRADEIDVRVNIDRENGVQCLLYKDARCDMTILDETVGPMYWRRIHTRDNRNCIVEIYFRQIGCWVGKEDTGVESRTEAQKGLASDSFKRACVNWGIGRELYTDIFIWIPQKFVKRDERGRCVSKFYVKKVHSQNDNIVYLDIADKSTKQVVFKFRAETADEDNANAIKQAMEQPKNDNVSVTTTQKIPAVHAVADKVHVKSSTSDVRNMAWKETASALGITTKQLMEEYKSLVMANILPDIQLKDLTDEQFDSVIRTFITNFTGAA